MGKDILLPWTRSLRLFQLRGCSGAWLIPIPSHRLAQDWCGVVSAWETELRGKKLPNFLGFRKSIVAFLKERKWNPEIALSFTVKRLSETIGRTTGSYDYIATNISVQVMF